MDFVNRGPVLAHPPRLGLHSPPVRTTRCFGCCHVDLLIFLCAGANSPVFASVIFRLPKAILRGNCCNAAGNPDNLLGASRPCLKSTPTSTLPSRRGGTASKEH